jgi:diguanylate cyclase
MVGFALAPLAIAVLLDTHIHLPYVISMGLAQPLNSILDISLWLLLLWLLHLNENPHLLRAIRIVAAISIVITSLDGLCLAISWHPAWLMWAQAADAIITVLNTIIEMLPLGLVGIAVWHRSHLDPASWIVAIFAFLDEMVVVITDALRQGQRFTDWTIGDELHASLFTIAGNRISLGMISRALLLISIVYAVYISYREERRRQIMMASEFEHARELQRLLIPVQQQRIPGFVFSSSYHPRLRWVAISSK